MVKSKTPTPDKVFQEAKNAVQAVRPPSRVGKRLVAAHVEPETAQRLKVLSALQGRSVQELLTEAIDLLFARHDKDSDVLKAVGKPPKK